MFFKQKQLTLHKILTLDLLAILQYTLNILTKRRTIL
jgi:hypothetical protein